jgi:SAM-dependent methyltransferase
MRNGDMTRLVTFMERNLPYMADSFDEGLGTTSERYTVNRTLLRFLGEHSEPGAIRRVLEAPVEGLMGVPGMNSVVFARDLGADVEIGSPSEAILNQSERFWNDLDVRHKARFRLMDDCLPYPDQSFDWVWNYCVIEHFDDARSVLLEMKRVSRCFVCVVIQNVYNYGSPIHWAYHLIRRRPWDHGYIRWMRLGGLARLFKACGLRILEKGCIDVPPWLDTFDMPIRGEIKKYMKQEDSEGWFWCSLQSGDMQKLTDNRVIQTLQMFESMLFFPFNYFFAHHFYIIGKAIEPSSNQDIF